MTGAFDITERMRRTVRWFRASVNEVLRLGLNAPQQLKPKGRFVIRARPFGLPPGLSYDNIGELLDQLDGPLRR